jgi:hypothetical protein
MLDNAGGSAFELAGSMSLPLWAGAVIISLLVIVSALAFIRDNDDARTGPMIRVALILVLGLAAGWTLDHFYRRDLEAERQVLVGRAFELSTRALMPGSALACLDSISGQAVEESCEKALFASPEAVAAAVSYVSAQLALVRAAHELASRGGVAGQEFRTVRRALETDRFGLVAHVLAQRDGCTADRCGTLALLQSTNRIKTNMAQRRFEAQVRSHATAWSHARSTAGTAEGVSSSSAEPPKGQNNLYFPSASSIPPVNIMTAEPATAPRQNRDAARAEEGGERKPASGAAPVRQPAPGAPGAPMQIAPSGQ